LDEKGMQSKIIPCNQTKQFFKEAIV